MQGYTMQRSGFWTLALAASTAGLMTASLETKKPIICGVLTTDDIAQARKRSDPNQMNKGAEFAVTAMSMAGLN